MGLLEKAQQRKQILKKPKEIGKSDISVEKKKEHFKPSGLLEKAKQKRQKIITEKTSEPKESKGVKKIKTKIEELKQDAAPEKSDKSADN